MLNVLYEDSAILVLDKPAGLVTTSSETNKEPSLEDILKNDFKIKANRGGIVHRLDKDTSGVLIVGKTDEIVVKLQQQFKERKVSKTYVALVHGWMEQGGRIDVPIGRNPGDREKFTVFPNQNVHSEESENDEDVSSTLNIRNAVTEYQPKQKLEMTEDSMSKLFSEFNKIQLRKLKSMQYSRFTLVECHPLTGRTHQIRVHLKYIGFPIVADGKYGGRKVVRLDHRFCPRQFLHAQKLELNHPESGDRLQFETPLPDDLAAALSCLATI